MVAELGRLCVRSHFQRYGSIGASLCSRASRVCVPLTAWALSRWQGFSIVVGSSDKGTAKDINTDLAADGGDLPSAGSILGASPASESQSGFGIPESFSNSEEVTGVVEEEVEARKRKVLAMLEASELQLARHALAKILQKHGVLVRGGQAHAMMLMDDLLVWKQLPFSKTIE